MEENANETPRSPHEGQSSSSKYEAPLWTSVVSGTLGGACGVIIGYPFESVKVRLQTGTTTGLYRSLYKGVLAPLLSVTPQWALMYFAYFAAQNGIERAGGIDSVVGKGAVSGAMCGLVVATVTTPSDAVKIVAQNERITALAAAKRLYSAGGFMHGYLATSVHFGLSQAIFFATYEGILLRMGDDEFRGIDWRPAIAGGLAGIVEWTTCLPTDTIKTRLQAGPVGQRYLDVLSSTYSHFGLRGFYRGYLPILLRAVPVNSSAYFIIESSNAILTRHL